MTELASDRSIDEGDEFSRAQIKASSKSAGSGSIVGAQLIEKERGKRDLRSKCVLADTRTEYAMPK